jgi:hypothetical protein
VVDRTFLICAYSDQPAGRIRLGCSLCAREARKFIQAQLKRYRFGLVDYVIITADKPAVSS